MLEVCRKKYGRPKEIKKHDTFTERTETKVTYDEKTGDKIEKRVSKKINVTKLVNERKKLLKERSAQETLNQLEKILTK